MGEQATGRRGGSGRSRRTALLIVALAIAAGISGSATHAGNGSGPVFATQDVSLVLGNGNKLVPTGVEVPTVSGAPVIVLATAGRTSTGGVLNGVLAVYDGAVQRSLLGANCCDPTGIAAGDIDGDGSPDVALASAGGGGTPPSFVTWNTPSGSFQGGGGGTIGNQGDGSGKPALGDLNGDGTTDLVIPVPGSGRLIILPGAGTAPSRVINTGGAQFLSVGSSPQAVAVADVNGDGNEDLLVAEHASGDVGVLLGNGDLTFQPLVQVPACAGPQDIAASDLNGDGLVDIAVACDTGSVAVRLGNGDGTFQAAVDYATGIGTRALRIADMNNDGHPDIVAVSSADDTVWSLYNPGDGTFPAVFSTALATGAQPWALAVADLNGDAIEDVVVADHGTVAFTMLTQSSLPNVTFGATASATSSTVQANASTVAADGTSTSTVTVRLDDGSGNPVAGKAVTLAPSGGSSTISTVNGTSDAGGVATFTVSDSVAETVAYTARDASDAVTLAQTATVAFTALPSTPAPAPPAPPAVTVSPPATPIPVQGPNHAPVIRYLIRAAPGTTEPMIDASSSSDPDGDSFSTEIHVVYCAGCPPPFSPQFAPPFDSYSYTSTWVNHSPYNGLLTATITEFDTRGASSSTTFTINDPLTAFPLTVQVAGRLVSPAKGAGEVLGDLPHLDCRTSCTAMVPLGAVVRLRAQQIPGGEQFVGWSGPCAGTGDCVLGLGGPATVVAQFGDAAPPQNVTPPQISDTPGAPPGPMPFSYYVAGGPFHPSYGTPAYAYLGTWDLPKPSSYEIRWLRCGTTQVCTPIPGATTRRYVPTLADVGEKLEVSVTAIRGGVASVAAYSAVGLQAIVDHHLHTATDPKTVTTGAVVVGQAGTEATIGGTFIAGGQDWTYGFVWGEGALDHSVPMGSWSQVSGFTAGNSDDSSQPLTTQLTGLVPGHTYEYELVATTNSTKYANFPATTIHGGVRTFVATPDSSRPAFLSVDFVPASGQEPTRLHVTVVPGATPVVFSGTWSGGSDTWHIQSGRINAGATPASQDSFYLDLEGLDPIQQGITYTYTIVADNGTGNTVTFTGSASIPWSGGLTTAFPGSITPTGATFYGFTNGPGLDSPSFVIGGGPTVQTTWNQGCAVCSGSMSGGTNDLSPGKTYTVQAQAYSEVPTQNGSCPNGAAVRARPYDNSPFCDGSLVQGQILRFTTPDEQPTGATFSGSTLGVSLGCVTSTGCGGSMTISTPTAADFSRGVVSQVERGLAGVASDRPKAPAWARSVPLGTRSFRIAGGKRLRIALAPSKVGRRYLTAHPSLRAVVVTLIERRPGRKPVESRSLTQLRRSR